MADRYGWRSIKTSGRVMLILILGVAPGWAVLGETESSVSADRQFLRGQIRVEVHQAYRIHQITNSRGTVVREYVSTAGQVFGIAWQGPFVPNMQQLLGSYFSYLQDYAQAQTAHHGGPLIIQKDNFMFANGGHMRWYRGHAYVPRLLPTNLSPEVVR